MQWRCQERLKREMSLGLGNMEPVVTVTVAKSAKEELRVPWPMGLGCCESDFCLGKTAVAVKCVVYSNVKPFLELRSDQLEPSSAIAYGEMKDDNLQFSLWG